MNQIEKEIRENIREFRIIDSIENTAEAHFLFPADFIGFKGHFLNNPILPGICIIKTLLVKLMIWLETSVKKQVYSCYQNSSVQLESNPSERILASDSIQIHLSEMKSIKFYSQVQPGNILEFESRVVNEAHSPFSIVNSKVTCNNMKIAQLKIKIISDPIIYDNQFNL